MTSRIGFIGLGTMGEPMALNLLKATGGLLVWNRSQDKLARVVQAGAIPAASAVETFAKSDVILMMLQNGAVIDAVMQRGSRAFADNVRNRTIVHLGTTAPSYSAALEQDVAAAGGRYVEAPVSGSRGPAEAGKLVGMMGGEAAAVTMVEPILASMTARRFNCGAVPNAMMMKMAVNAYLAGLITALMEATNLAVRGGLDLQQFSDILWNGPMSNDVMRMKLPKLISRDYATQASVINSIDSLALIKAAAAGVFAAVPIVEACEPLYRECNDMGYGEQDFIAVLEAFARRSGPSP